MSRKVEAILLVEDEPDHVEIVSRALARDGIEVVAVGDGVAALAALEGRRFDLVLMDLQIPGLDGWETTRRIKARPDLRAIPVVAFTACALSGDRDRALAAGCDDTLLKPCSTRALRATITRWCGELSGTTALV